VLCPGKWLFLSPAPIILAAISGWEALTTHPLSLSPVSARSEAPTPMTSAGSVTHWIGQLKAGDPAAAQQLWEGYFRKMVELARQKLQGLRAAPPTRRTWR
jgi:ECF sigma factor